MAKLALSVKFLEGIKNAKAFCPNAANESFAYIGNDLHHHLKAITYIRKRLHLVEEQGVATEGRVAS
jgi:hypothetical protein